MADDDDRAKGLAKAIARAWADPVYKAKLKRQPHEALREEGIEVGPELEIKVFEDTETVAHLVIPMRPAGIKMMQPEGFPGPGGPKWVLHPDLTCTDPPKKKEG